MSNYKFNDGNWQHLTKIKSQSFVCYNCENQVASDVGYYRCDGRANYNDIYICPHCNAPNIWDSWGKSPVLKPYGNDLKKLPQDVDIVYSEARKCMSVGAYTASAMMMRKLLMNFAVEKGAKEGDSFSNYVKYLCDESYIHRANRKMAEKIRGLGNEANHKVTPINEDDAKNIFDFVTLVLIYNYSMADPEETDEAK